MRRKTGHDYHTLARARRLTWLGPEVRSTRTKTGWRCARDHHWKTTYNTLRQGTGCPYCAGTVRKRPADYHTLAGQKGLVWLGPIVANAQTKTVWQCAQGHRYHASFNAVRSAQHCPRCPTVLRKTAADYQALARQKGFRWLGPEVSDALTNTTWQCAAGHPPRHRLSLLCRQCPQRAG